MNSLIFCLFWSTGSIMSGVSAETTYDVIPDIDFTQELSDNSFASYRSLTKVKCSFQCSATVGCCAVIYSRNISHCFLYNECNFDYGMSLSSQISLIKNISSKVEWSRPTSVYQDCQEALERGDIVKNGIYTLRPNTDWNKTVEAVCQFDSSSGWTVIQKRLDGSENVYRDWDDYVAGFGNRSGEYWIGLDAIFWLTQSNQKLSVFLVDHNGEQRTANYSSFRTADKEHFYQLSISGYEGDAGDSMTTGYFAGIHNDMKFSTFDNDHDIDTRNCAELYKGGWWYNQCHNVNINGIWYPGGAVAVSGAGASWFLWKGHDYSYKTIYMRVTR